MQELAVGILFKTPCFMGENYKLRKIVLSLCTCMYHITEYICVCVFILDKAIHNRQLSVERPLEEQVSEIKNIYDFFLRNFCKYF